jgi:hypothetical protein
MKIATRWGIIRVWFLRHPYLRWYKIKRFADNDSSGVAVYFWKFGWFATAEHIFWLRIRRKL